MPPDKALPSFFRVDRHTWATVCDIGLDMSVAYMVLARGATLKGRSAWSANALHKRTGMPERTAKRVLRDLVASDLVERLGAGGRPTYRLRTPNELGLAPEPTWIAVPSVIVDGTGDVRPLAELYQGGFADALRLLVDLYGAQDLKRFGGVDWRLLMVRHRREKLGSWGNHVVWGFRKETLVSRPNDLTRPYMRETASEGHKDPGWAAFWDAFGALQQFDLVEIVEHLVSQPIETGALYQPCPTEAGSAAEVDLMHAHRQAAEAILPAGTWATARNLALAVVPGDEDVNMVGIVRLTHQADTTATVQWATAMPSLNDWPSYALRWPSYARRLRKIAEQAISA